jgi:hypothetical protein
VGTYRRNAASVSEGTSFSNRCFSGASRLNQRDKDLQTISALGAAGSNLSKSHGLEHHFVSKKKASLESLRNHAISRKDQVSEILSAGLLSKTYFLDIIIDTVPMIENVTLATTMHQLAAKAFLFIRWLGMRSGELKEGLLA